MKNINKIIILAIVALFTITGCATTSGGYKPDPLIPAKELATLKIADLTVYITAIDGIETSLKYPKSIQIQEGKHIITCYHQKAKEITAQMAKTFGTVNYLTKIEFEFIGGHNYELYDTSKTKIIGTMQSTEYGVDVRESK
ncbi:MAG: hypothetical protein LBV07_00890 [Syntrophobacterales bacterium]|jgi:hypothetical protein|nr:hypothetical protein [Syntrophobacterales bacterium]